MDNNLKENILCIAFAVCLIIIKKLKPKYPKSSDHQALSCKKEIFQGMGNTLERKLKKRWVQNLGVQNKLGIVKLREK